MLVQVAKCGQTLHTIYPEKAYDVGYCSQAWCQVLGLEETLSFVLRFARALECLWNSIAICPSEYLTFVSVELVQCY